METEYLTVRQLATLLQVDPKTIKNWIHAGRLDFIQIGRDYRIPWPQSVRASSAPLAPQTQTA